METLFAEHDVNRDDQARGIRRLALGGALQLIRAARRWNVNDAAHAAGIAPMTWRRMEDGLTVRDRSYAALDNLLDLTAGTVKRALADDRVMAGLVRTVTGEDVVAAGGLAAFAEQTRTGSPRQERNVWPAVSDGTTQALAAAAQHVPAERPTTLELTHRLIERLVDLDAGRSSTISSLIRAACEAVPDLAGLQLDEVDRAQVDRGLDALERHACEAGRTTAV